MKITLKRINSFDPCYDTKEIGLTKDLKLTPIEFIDQFRDKVKKKEDIIWVLVRKQFITDRNLRLFAVWCAREALKLVDNPDIRSINACNISERFANGEATMEELDAARDNWAAARDAWAAARNAARDAAWDAAWNAPRNTRAAARDAAINLQIDKLKDYLK